MVTSYAPAASLWRHQGFRRLFAGASVSWFGSEISELAIPLFVIISLNATETQVGLVRTAQFLPFLLLTLYAGVLVDRLRRRPLLIAADLGRFVIIGVIPAMAWLGTHRVEPLYVLVFAAGVLTVVHQLADLAYLPTLIGRDRLLEANGRLAAAQSAAQLSGQGVGGLLVAALTAPVAVLVDALSYLFSGLAIAGIRHTEPAPVTTRRRLRTEIAEGLRHVIKGRYLRALVGEAATFNLFNEIFMIGMLLWLAREQHVFAAIIGLVISLGAFGAFTGAAVGARLSKRFGFGRTMVITMAVGNGAPVALIAARGGDPGSLALFGAVFTVMGFGIALANVHNATLRQTVVPDRLQGRVNASYRLVSWGAVPTGAALGGLLADHFGAHTGMLTGALGIASATLWVACSPIPRLREAPTV